MRKQQRQPHTDQPEKNKLKKPPSRNLPPLRQTKQDPDENTTEIKEKKLELIILSQPKRPEVIAPVALPQAGAELPYRMPQMKWKVSPARPAILKKEETEPGLKYSMREVPPNGLDAKGQARLAALIVEGEQLVSMVYAASGAVFQYKWSGKAWVGETRILEKEVLESLKQELDTPMVAVIPFEGSSLFFFFNKNPIVVFANNEVFQLPETFCGSLSKHAAVMNGELYFLSDWNQRTLVKYSRRSLGGGKIVQPSTALLKEICDFCFFRSPTHSCVISLSATGWVFVDDLHKLHLSSTEPANTWTSIACQGSHFFACGWNIDFMTSHVVAFTAMQGEPAVQSSVCYSLEADDSTQSRNC
jgi:hypothetical protein